MFVSSVLHAILGNLVLVLIVVALSVSAVKVRRAKGAAISVSNTLWGELLLYAIGLGLIWGFFFHAFAQQLAASSIGWQPSPFEWELAWAELGLAVAAIFAFFRGYDVRLAVTAIFFIFSFGCTVQHVNEIVCCQNYHPGNAGTVLWINDIALPIALAILAFAARPLERFNR